MRTKTARLLCERLDDRTTPAGLDPSYGVGGTAAVPLPTGPDAWELAAAGPDGRVAVASVRDGTLSVARLTAAGKLDTAFAGDGTAEVDVSESSPLKGLLPTQVAVAGDGSVAVVGSTTRDGGSTLAVVRLGADGRLDAGFDGDGLGVYATPGGMIPGAVAVAVDGTVTVGGTGLLGGKVPTTTTKNGDGVVTDVIDLTAVLADPPRPTRGVLRLRPDGTPDASFGKDGYADLTGRAVDRINRLLELPDGDVLVVGSTDRVVPNAAGSTMSLTGFDPSVTRLNADGSVDAAYGTDGTATFSIGAERSGSLIDADLTADGGLLLTLDNRGFFSESTATGTLARLTAGGRLDAGFGGDGLVSLPGTYGGPVAGTTLGPDGRAVVAFGAFGPTGVELYGLAPDGTIDGDFGRGGRAFIPAPGGETLWYFPTVFDLPGGRIGVVSRPSVVDPNDPTRISALDPDAPTAPLPEVPEAFLQRQAEFARISVFGFVPIFPEEANKNTNVALADVNGDGTNDTIFAAGAGNKPYLRVIDGRTREDLVPATLVYEASFTGGVLVEAADLNGDGKAEVVVAPMRGGGARVQVFGAAGGGLQQLDNYLAIEDKNFRGGARIAVGDVNADGTPDLTVAAGDGGGPRVAVYDGTGLTARAAAPRKLVGDFFAFGGADAATLRNGVFVAAGDLDGDGAADLSFGGGPGGGSRVRAVSGAGLLRDPAGAVGRPMADFFAGDPAGRGGVLLEAVDLDGDGKADLVTRPRGTNDPGVRVYTADGGAFREDAGLAPLAGF